MDFDLSDDLKTYRQSVVRFAQEQLNADLIRRDSDSEFPTEAWKKCAHFGIQGLPVPSEYGGGGADAFTTMVALEALGYGCKDNGLIFSLNAQMWSCEIPLMKFGSEDQKRRYLPGLCEGSIIGVQAMTEPGSGSDAFSMAAVARKQGDDYVIDGVKTFITNAPIADVFVVFASTDPKSGFAGTSAFIVDSTTPGVKVGQTFKKMGLRTSPMSEVVFNDCKVSSKQMLGSPGAGMAIFNASMDWERGCILAACVGTMERQLEQCLAYARDRKQFGQPIGKFQGVSHRIVEMKVRLETARLLLYRLGWMKRRNKPTPMESAMVKLYLSECFIQSSLDALYIHGGNGYMTEYELERDVRDAIGSRLYSGTSDIQKNIIAGYMGL